MFELVSSFVTPFLVMRIIVFITKIEPVFFVYKPFKSEIIKLFCDKICAWESNLKK